ncbi:MAG: hypothetical protein V1821_00565, partial [bacterium]
MSNTYYAIALLLVAALNLYYVIRFLVDRPFAENYTRKSPKAALWRKIFGPEKALKIIRGVFAPIGLIVGVGLVVFAIVLFRTPDVATPQVSVVEQKVFSSPEGFDIKFSGTPKITEENNTDPDVGKFAIISYSITDGSSAFETVVFRYESVTGLEKNSASLPALIESLSQSSDGSVKLLSSVKTTLNGYPAIKYSIDFVKAGEKMDGVAV